MVPSLIFFLALCLGTVLAFRLPTMPLGNTRSSSHSRLWVALEPRAEDIVSEVEMCTFDRAGVVLLAQPGEHDHWLVKAAVFVFEHNEQGTQGVILGKASAFSLGETAPGIGLFQPNTLFMGGDQGPDMALMFHKYPLGGYAKYVGGGVDLGGLRQARELCEARQAAPNDFKFIFNNVQWAPGVLDAEIAASRWDVVRLPPDMVLQQKQASAIWSQARTKLRAAGGKRLHQDDDYGDDE